MVRSQNYTKLAWGIMAVICWLVPLSLSWTLSLNWRSGITCLKCLFCPLVSLPVWHLIWTFLCVFICGVHAWMHVQLYVLACAFLLLLLLLWLNTDWGREGRMRKQRQEWGKGAEAETMEETLFTGLLIGTWPATFFIDPRSSVLEIYHLWWPGPATLAVNEIPHGHTHRPSQLR